MSPATPKSHKRRKTNRSHSSHSSHSAEEHETEETPRQERRQQHHPSHLPQPTTRFYPAASAASTTSSSHEDTSSLASGQSSPSKMFSVLAIQPKGISKKLVDTSDPDMPVALVRFVTKMERIGKPLGVVPVCFEPEISRLQETYPPFLSFDPTVYKTCTTKDCPGDCSSCSSTYTLDGILDMVAYARSCFNMEMDEAGWNNLVHTPLLMAAIGSIRTNSLVGLVPCTSARIVPGYRIDNIPGKKVDYVLALEPRNDPVDGIQAESTLLGLRRAWHDAAANHTEFIPIASRPVAASIETKRDDGHTQKAALQMGIWQTGQWKFLLDKAGPDALEELPFLPGIVVHGHRWCFVATTYTNGKTTLWTETEFGKTSTPLGTFQAIEGLREINAWAANVFWPWYKTHVLKMPIVTPSQT
ncbi:hypothetical protein LY76DRAFT_527917 [Colletotrichum caudatum]|nr:hypothetical protein LY76DRAFT_527917 [Colletotrichum caudatum]